MKCPMCFGAMIHSDKPYELLRGSDDCVGNACAWWVGEKCAIAKIAEALKEGEG